MAFQMGLGDGMMFREESSGMAAHRNRLENNCIEENAGEVTLDGNEAQAKTQVVNRKSAQR